MTITSALLLTALCATAGQDPILAGDRPASAATTTREATSSAGPEFDRPVPPPRARALDPRHRIEVRFGGWTDGWYGYEDGWRGRVSDWHTSGSAQGAFGFEYLTFVRDDLGIGLAVTGLASARGDWGGWDRSGTTQVTTSIPVVVRWYPARRLTHIRTVEPYAAAGIGPVFGVDTSATDGLGAHDWRHGGITRTRVATAVGGRLGGGVDIRLGSLFTLGVAGAWNWDAGLPDDLWSGARPSGGEFTVVLGWVFGR